MCINGNSTCPHVIHPIAKKSIFLGYGIGVWGYKLYDTKTSRVFHDRDVIFNEPGSIGELEREKNINRPRAEVECQDICDGDDDGDGKSQKATGPRRSPRITRTPHRYGEWVYIPHDLNDPTQPKIPS